eukprot:Partr_v1_DN23057_c0_g2_i1_m27123 putative Component of the coenzyme Q biosynthetic pathway. May play a role in organizing a multi-subunit COQ enzyme complex required for coenzyme Q biosynthesis. Required for steady-state levels of other COQ polypeptides (By similarity)
MSLSCRRTVTTALTEYTAAGTPSTIAAIVSIVISLSTITISLLSSMSVMSKQLAESARRFDLLARSALGALADPTRQDLVAAVGELLPGTHHALHSMRRQMLMHPDGRRILRNRPIVTSSTLPESRLAHLPDGTFGRAYLHFLHSNRVSPDTRAPTRHLDGDGGVDDEELEYVMLRYRQTHDFVHALTGMPTTLSAELAIKWFEYAQTGLPMTLLAGVTGPVRLPTFKDHTGAGQKDTGYLEYLKYALQAGSSMRPGMMCVYWEEWLEVPVEEMRSRLNVPTMH